MTITEQKAFLRSYTGQAQAPADFAQRWQETAAALHPAVSCAPVAFGNPCGVYERLTVTFDGRSVTARVIRPAADGVHPLLLMHHDLNRGVRGWHHITRFLALGFGVVAGLTRYTRAELSEVLTGAYMLLARTKGLTKAQAISRHALRNAMVVILPMIIGEFIGILGGSMIIENIFGIPGIGNLYINSINVRDYNFFMALNVFYTAIGLVSGIVIDISYGFIDPRIRMGSKK